MKPFLQKSALALFILLTCTAALAQQPGTHSTCTPTFPLAQPWLGADAAYSIPLPDGRDVWIFGDTLYGDKRVVVGDEPRMVRNSIGISTCKAGKWELHYIIRHSPQGKPLDFFTAQRPNTWYWALDGVVHNNELWITLLCIRNAHKTSSAGLGFEVCGTDLAHITGINAVDPQTWKITYSELVPDATRSYPSATTVIDGDYLYIFSLVEFGERPMALTRIRLSGLSNARRNLEYLTLDGTWQGGFDPKDAKAVMSHGSSEMSVRYHPELKKWVAISFAPAWLSDTIVLRTADQLTGPWNEGEPIFKVSEMKKGAPGYDPDTFCYAGKEHPEFEKPGEIVFTYACNTLKPAKLATMQNIYFPRSVRMKAATVPPKP